MADEVMLPQWYAVHTYSGYENKVKMDIEKTIENRNLHDQMLEVAVPMYEEEEEIKEGKKQGQKKNVQKKLFPGYVLIHMYLNDDTWYVVRNTRGVTGFVGPGSKPVPLTDEEVMRLGMSAVNKPCDFKEGDSVVVIAGVWKDTIGLVKSVNEVKERLTIVVDMFGRETPVELSFSEVKQAE